MSRRWFLQQAWVSWIGVLSVLVLWQAMVTFGLVNVSVVPGPVEALRAAGTQLPTSTILRHTAVSLGRIVMGFAVGAVAGVSIGIASGWYRWLGSALSAPIELIRPIPPLAWLPLALIWFGLGEGSKVFIIALGAFFPVVTNTYKAMSTLEPSIMRAAHMLGLDGLKLLFRVALPASMPDIAVGLRVGWSLSFGTMIAAEIIGAKSGLGFMIMFARELGQVGIIVFGIFFIGLLNLVTDFLIREYILRRQLRWHFAGLQNA